MKKKKPLLTIQISEVIYPRQVGYLHYRPLVPWIFPGRYDVIREFDENRYIIRLNPNTITLVDKSFTKVVS